MPASHITRTDLVAGLRELGVQPADLVLVHCALSRFGYLEGGPRSVIEAFVELLGPQGTLAVPGFTFQLFDVPAPVFDVRNTPCWTSKVYELFRKEYATHRSHHATHSVCAMGARAAELTAGHGASSFGPTSPFCKLATWLGRILLLGVPHNNSTTFHAVEEQEKLFYYAVTPNPHATIIDEQGKRRPLPTLLHTPTASYDFNRMNEALLREGIQREQFIGDAMVRCVDAHAMFEYTVAAVRRDPAALVCLGERVQTPIMRRDGEIILG